MPAVVQPLEEHHLVRDQRRAGVRESSHRGRVIGRAARAAGILDHPGTLAGAKQLAVSLEPSGGSPTGLPTGPVLHVAALAPA